MNKLEMLKGAMQKASDRGWDDEGYKSIEVAGAIFVYQPDMPHILYEPDFIIFNHDFAKALWGEENIVTSRVEVSRDKTVEGVRPAWKAHLTFMVIAEDPIQYLGDNI